MKLKYCLIVIATSLLLSACGGEPPYKSQVYKSIADELAIGVTEEKIYNTYYDNDDNRFYVELYYDLHLGLSLRIEEYDLRSFIFYPNEGVVSDDYESITFKYSAMEKSDLFSRGDYVLSHNVYNNKDVYTLSNSGKTYVLTETKKDNPRYILEDLVGEFAYIENEESLFTMTVEVGEKEEHYPVSISMVDGDKTFTCTHIINYDDHSTFDIEGEASGDYIKVANDASFTYNEGAETYILQFEDRNYSLTKTKGRDDPVGLSNYFVTNSGKIKVVSNDFEVTISNSTGDGRTVFLLFKELVSDGNPNFWCWFEVIDEETITNVSAITNKNNKVFTGHDTYTFKHKVENDIDVVDVYFDNVLTYSNCEVIPNN